MFRLKEAKRRRAFTKLWRTKLRGRIQQVKEEFEELLRIMEQYNVTRVLELGCLKGGTALGFLEIGCHVVSIDINPQPEAVELTKERPTYSILVGQSHEFHDVLHTLPKFDMLFIDGDHEYSKVKADYENLVKYVKPGGLVAFHDIYDSEYAKTHGCHVPRYWKEIRGEDYIDIIGDEFWGGIGVKFL